MRYAPWEMDFPLTSPPWLATSIHPDPAALTHPIAGQSQDIDAFVIVVDRAGLEPGGGASSLR